MASKLTVATIYFEGTGTSKLEYNSTDDVARFYSKGIKVPSGDTGSRPTIEEGVIRYNTTLGKFEFSNSSAWASVHTAAEAAALSSSTGVGSNAFTSATISGANTAVGNGANTYWQNTMLGANTLILATANGWANTKLTNSTATLAGSLTTTGSLIDSKGDVRTVPVNSKTSAYAVTTSDIGKFVSITTGGIFVPNAVFSAGDAVSIYNNSGASQTITQNTSVTMYLAGTSSTGNRTISQRGIATVLCVAANTFVITGSGIS